MIFLTLWKLPYSLKNTIKMQRSIFSQIIKEQVINILVSHLKFIQTNNNDCKIMTYLCNWLLYPIFFILKTTRKFIPLMSFMDIKLTFF